MQASQPLRNGNRLACGFAALLFCFLAALSLSGSAAFAQTGSATEETQNGDIAQSTLRAVGNLLQAENTKLEEADQLRSDIESALTDVDKKNLGDKLQIVNTELEELQNQIVRLATGNSESEFGAAEQEFELQDELEQLIRPFVWILKSATENAREIEHLKRTVLSITEQSEQIEIAIGRLKPMIELAAEDGPAKVRLEEILRVSEMRLLQTQDRAVTVREQLHTRLSRKIDPADAASSAFASFFSDRGRNLLFGIIAFATVFMILRFLRKVLLTLIGAPRNRSFPVRLGLLIFDVLTVCLAFGTTITIFNYYNDWFLTGAMLLAFLTIGWFVLKSLPSLVEQVTLLLNLGAVQEGERVVINNVPWRVTKLDLYSDLENPSLRGGHYTVPVRELRGQHSRPMDSREHWFPSEEGDWVVLENGLWAEVVLQSPETVQLREEGGAISHFTTTAYLEQNPKNVSTPYRATIEFGLDYAHQSDAADTIPSIMKAYVDKKLRARFGSENIVATYVALFRAGDSSLDYEIEADIGAGMGHLFESVEHALSRFAVECCSENGWTIPFPQMTVHRQT